jgi:hypothetical protein
MGRDDGGRGKGRARQGKEDRRPEKKIRYVASGDSRPHSSGQDKKLRHSPDAAKDEAGGRRKPSWQC